MEDKEAIVFDDAFIRKAFKGYDMDGNGEISSHEFKVVMKRWTKMSDAEIEDILKKGDRDQNGTISFSEFTRMLQG